MVAPLVPPAVQTEGVVVVKVTASPDDAVALTVTGDCPKARSGNCANEMVWFSRFATEKLRMTGDAAL